MPAAIDLDHVAVATERQSDAWPRYGGDLAGAWVAGGWSAGFASAQVRFANQFRLEVLQPADVERNDFLRRFLDRNGPGPHHLTYKVPDLARELDRLRGGGYDPVGIDLSDPEWKEAFVHPKQVPGLVVQLAQAEGEGWSSPPPPGFPAPRTKAPATLVHVAHAVADLDRALRLFVDLLDGVPMADGKDDGEGARWIDLAWPGPGRLRLLSPTGGALAAWLGEREGRFHHLAFACERPDAIPDAVAASATTYEVAPELNLGIRLRLAPDPAPFASSWQG